LGYDEMVYAKRERIRAGGSESRKRELSQKGKQFVRDRLAKLLDPGFTLEDWILARSDQPDLPADGVVTVVGKIAGRPVCVMANDMTVKAGTWGVKTIEKIMRIQDVAFQNKIPIIYLVDSGGARIDEQYETFIDRRHAGKIFWNMARMNGVVPQISVNFGPSPAGAAYLPAFCDLVVMVEGHTSVYLGSPRMAEAVIGEKTTHEEMGGARMHCTVSGLGDVLAADEDEAIEIAKRYLSYLPSHWQELPPDADPVPPKPGRPVEAIVPMDQTKPFDMYELIDRLVDAGTFFEIKKMYAPELITGLARLDGMPVGIMANQSMVKGGVLYANSAEKGAQFVSLCTAFNIPIVTLMDVSGFMIGTQAERTAIIRRGQKMLQAVAEATQPRICVVVRKGYGAGYMAMSGATFQPDAIIALPQAKLALMGPDAAVQAIYARKLEEIDDPEERRQFIAEKRQEYEKNITIWGPASEMYIDDVVPGEELRQQLIERLRLYRRRQDPNQVLVARRTHILRG
jgi:acetyl-CoA carboxylase carboxyltransferase component